MPEIEPIRVLLVDDHPVVRDGYRRLLENLPNIRAVAEAGTGAEGYRQYLQCAPDVVVIDLSLPDIGGLEVIRRIMMRDACAKILVFSVHENSILMERALDAGAKGYITKRSTPKVLIAAIRAVARGDLFLDPSRPAASAPDTGRASCLLTLKQLTPREFEVFLHLAGGRSVAEIAALLHASTKTVGVHRTRIMKKLGASNAAQLVHIAMDAGVIVT